MISVETANGGVVVRSPYSPEFASFAKMRNGKWSDSKGAWLFDSRDEIAVCAALYDIFGTDDFDACQKCDLRVNLDAWDTSETSYVAISGWIIVDRKEYQRARLAKNVVLVSGGFDRDGYIRKRGYYVCAYPGTVVEVRDIPVSIARRFAEEHPEHAQIIGSLDLEQLRAERELLIRRMDEIDQAIEMMEARQHVCDDEFGILPDLADDAYEPPAGGDR